MGGTTLNPTHDLRKVKSKWRLIFQFVIDPSVTGVKFKHRTSQVSGRPKLRGLEDYIDYIW